MTDGSGISTTDSSANEETYKNIVADIVQKYEAITDAVQDNSNPRAKFAACLVRFAGHDFMDFRIDSTSTSGGADGCMAFSDGDNFGLTDCILDTDIVSVYQNYCT